MLLSFCIVLWAGTDRLLHGGSWILIFVPSVFIFGLAHLVVPHFSIACASALGILGLLGLLGILDLSGMLGTPGILGILRILDMFGMLGILGVFWYSWYV